MTRLDELTGRLEQQFLDRYQLVLDLPLKTEAFRESLAYINSLFGENYSIAGLDSAESTSLPAEFLPVLMRGAAGNILKAVLQHNQASYSNLGLDADAVSAWARYLDQERDHLLDRLRTASLHNAHNQPWLEWKLKERRTYD